MTSSGIPPTGFSLNEFVFPVHILIAILDIWTHDMKQMGNLLYVTMTFLLNLKQILGLPGWRLPVADE